MSPHWFIIKMSTLVFLVWCFLANIPPYEMISLILMIFPFIIFVKTEFPFLSDWLLVIHFSMVFGPCKINHVLNPKWLQEYIWIIERFDAPKMSIDSFSVNILFSYSFWREWTRTSIKPLNLKSDKIIDISKYRSALFHKMKNSILDAFKPCLINEVTCTTCLLFCLDTLFRQLDSSPLQSIPPGISIQKSNASQINWLTLTPVQNASNST